MTDLIKEMTNSIGELIARVQPPRSTYNDALAMASALLNAAVVLADAGFGNPQATAAWLRSCADGQATVH